MMGKKFLIWLMLVAGFQLGFSPLFAQEAEKAEEIAAAPAEEEPEITEGEFAIRLVKLMKLESRLPLAPLKEDYISLLEEFGISPLVGWDADRVISRENYVVIMAMAAGKEEVVHEKAQEACDRNIEAINSRWELKHTLEGKWVSLEELFEDEVYFPQGPLKCPYRKAYKDKDKDHKIDVHNHFGRRLLKKQAKKE